MPVIIFFVVLLILVIAHEFGHFIVAKKSGIRVDEFAFGFPPKLFGVKKGETTYSFNALPLGGYVKIYGENPDDVTDDKDKARSFVAKPRIIQAAVIVAGVVFNLLLAWLLLSAMLVIGINAPVDSGDTYPLENVRLMVTDIQAKSPADISGIAPGDVLISLTEGSETVRTSNPDEVIQFISSRDRIPVIVTHIRNGESLTTTVTPTLGIVSDRAAIGISMDKVGLLRLPVHIALWEGAQKTYGYTILTATGLWDFLSTAVMGKSDFSQVTGPVGIVSAVGEAAGLGFAHLLLFTALISINLAVINVIPFPALDGGRLLFIIIESIIRRPIPAVIQNYTNIAGFSLLMLLMVLVTWHDIANLVK